MRVVFSRKGFDGSAGGAPSPILDGRPVSLPIPAEGRSETRYADLGLGALVEAATRGRIAGDRLCHHDPMFEGTGCAFGQTGAAQTHLANRGVGVGDLFLFFGLFSTAEGRDRHHRLFGYLQVAAVVGLGAQPGAGTQPAGFSRRHPHTLGRWHANNTLYLGPGGVATTAPERLRLTRPGQPVSRWRIPPWLHDVGLSYHARPDRWAGDDTLTAAARGQEFVADIGTRADARQWCAQTVAAIRGAGA